MTSTVDTTRTDVPQPVSPGGRRVARPDRWGLGLLLTGTAVLYLWGLSANGWANSFYSAAIQAGSVSWKAWFFGSSDAANSITVDKPPMSLWIPGIAVRVFGLNSWSILVPQALMGVASVALLSAIVRRYVGWQAGLLAGLALALTPVAALMFRFDNPDALLVLLMLGAVWATLRGIDDGRIRWMVLTGAFVGFGFLTKQLQVFLVIPPLAIAYLAFGQHSWVKRIGHLLAAGVALVVAAGWWVLAVTLWPKDSRPYIGGSQHNSILELTFGYNGFGRLTGNETGSTMPGGGRNNAAFAEFARAAGFPAGGPGGRGGSMWGETGFWRMFQPEQGGQIAWLIPAAVILGVAALVICGRAARTDLRRALLVVMLLWFAVTYLTFSFMSGIFHAYYTVALAPAIAGVVGTAGWMCWLERQRIWVRAVLAASVVATGVMAFVLLGRSSDFVPWLRWIVLVGAVIAAVAVVLTRIPRVAAIGAALAVILGLAGPAAYAVDTVSSSVSGSIISAGPRVAGGFGPGGHGGPGRFGGRGGPGQFGAGQPGAGQFGGGQAGPGRFGAQQGQPGQAGLPGAAGATGSRAGGFGGMGGPGGGLLEGSRPSAELTALLERDADRYTWMAAAIGSNSASGYQLATQQPVMPIGGFNGSDPSPTLAQFQQYVREGKIHWFIAGGGFGGGMNARGTASDITAWVEKTYTARTVGSVTLYDLTDPR
ncbi:glycosyltransferase family 39 protein [Williamsia deligens]|uniref:Glycosyltransferase family 39 protein n=1 Tax=Williamsia deligens TaxID=321325 RepID=A0ABW3G7N1_9NOCA|nr:glycosyltransferase family 39 protein [Williamsia deligens]MCP2193073.1 4-amino-4-deoxy-L-arabinose transferase [Williamsia deligens]